MKTTLTRVAILLAACAASAPDLSAPAYAEPVMVSMDHVGPRPVSYSDKKPRTIDLRPYAKVLHVAPNGDFLPREIERNDAGYVVTRDTLETAMPGIWAVGALRAGYSGLLPDAVSEAKQAARSIVERLG